MKRGTIRKRESEKQLILEKIMLGTNHILVLNRENCIGCSICTKVCPREASKLSEATTQKGRLLKRGMVDIDAGRCSLCGECVVLCPANAIEMSKSGKPTIPVIEAEVFPTLLKSINIEANKCDPSCQLACAESCPTKAINVVAEKDNKGKITKILKVDMVKDKCIFCGKCEPACPQNAIHVVKPFQGFNKLNIELCPVDCQVCVDACPTKAISLDKKGKPLIAEEYCIYCGTCQEVCPGKAITIERTRVLYVPVKSGAWMTALEKVTSAPYVVKELNSKSARKLRETIQGTK